MEHSALPNCAALLNIEILEDRAVPGTLTITPVGSGGSGDSYIVFISSSAPKGGLMVAQAHTSGIVTWTPGT